MKATRLLGSCARSLRRQPLRTFFMTLGSLVGVTALAIVVAYGRGTQDAVLDTFERVFSGSTILLSAGGGGQRGGPHASGPTATLTLEDLEAIAASVPAVRAVDPMFALGSRDVVYDGVSRRPRIVGHSARHPEVWSRGAAAGGYFDEADVRSSRRVAVIGERVARELFGGRDPLGEIIRIDGAPYEVIGVLEPAGIDPHGVDRDFEIHVPITTALRRLLNVDYITTARFAVDPAADLDAAVLDIEAVLRDRHGLAPSAPDDFTMYTPVQVRTLIRSGNRTFTVLLPAVAAISLIVGALVIATLMLASVSERRPEIGLRKAVGARRRDIVSQIMLETLAVTGAGGILALAAARTVLGRLEVSAIAGRSPSADPEAAARVALSLPWEVAVLGLVATIVVGLAAGAIPARRAAALDPVVTLR